MKEREGRLIIDVSMEKRDQALRFAHRRRLVSGSALANTHRFCRSSSIVVVVCVVLARVPSRSLLQPTALYLFVVPLARFGEIHLAA